MSIYPYGVDPYEVEDNYIKSEPGFEGDVIKAALKNRLADSVEALERDMQYAPTTRGGDVKTDCVVHQFSEVKLNTWYYITVPSEVSNYVASEGLTNTETPLVYLFNLRPADSASMDFWKSVTYQGAMHIEHTIESSKIKFRILDPDGVIAQRIPTAVKELGTYIASVIFFRQ